jgi:hypothetical protein
MRALLSKLKKPLVKIFKNTAFITLFATTLGVLLAFYLNGIAEASNKKKREIQGYSNVISELEKNKLDVEHALLNDTAIIKLANIIKYDKRLVGQIVAKRQHIDSIMNDIEVATILDSVDAGNGYVNYLVDYDNVGFTISTLPKVAWVAAQMADITNEINYDCLSTIIDIYMLQDLYESEHYKLLEYYIQEKYFQFYRTLMITRILRTQLLAQYDEAIAKIKECS